MARLLFFGALGDAMGRQRNVDISADTRTVGMLIARLSAGDPVAAATFARTRIKVAVNEAIVSEDCAISNDDEIAFLPPFSGG